MATLNIENVYSIFSVMNRCIRGFHDVDVARILINFGSVVRNTKIHDVLDNQI